jgi:uncharacterized protein YjaZ
MWNRVADARLIVRWPVIGLLFASSLCCGNAATAPSDARLANRIVIADPSGQLRPHEATLRATLDGMLARVAPMFALTDVTITVTADASQAIGGYGVGGFTPDRRTVRLYVDPDFPGLAEVLSARIGPMLAHELHHAARWRSPGYGATLGEAMISEGLADRFAIELTGVAVPPWCQAFPDAEVPRWLDRARPMLHTSYSHSAWFFGADPDLPRWTGYTLGYHFVTAYIERHPGSSAASLVAAPASQFLPN